MNPPKELSTKSTKNHNTTTGVQAVLALAGKACTPVDSNFMTLS